MIKSTKRNAHESQKRKPPPIHKSPKRQNRKAENKKKERKRRYLQLCPCIIARFESRPVQSNSIPVDPINHGSRCRPLTPVRLITNATFHSWHFSYSTPPPLPPRKPSFRVIVGGGCRLNVNVIYKFYREVLNLAGSSVWWMVKVDWKVDKMLLKILWGLLFISDVCVYVGEIRKMECLFEHPSETSLKLKHVKQLWN